MNKKCYIICLITIVVLCAVGCNGEKNERHNSVGFDKPVVYLYGYNEDVDVYVRTNDTTKITVSYPEYSNGWHVHAMPDGHLSDGKNTYRYLYYELQTTNVKEKMANGFCIRGEDTAQFLEEKLAYMGLLPDEINEFIIYWLPQMQCNAYNMITFLQNEEIDEIAKIDVSPRPNNMLRVYMVWQPMQTFVEIQEQDLEKNNMIRTGKTVVEWGGSRMDFRP